jgi:hypothetical protein
LGRLTVFEAVRLGIAFQLSKACLKQFIDTLTAEGGGNIVQSNK